MKVVFEELQNTFQKQQQLRKQKYEEMVKTCNEKIKLEIAQLKKKFEEKQKNQVKEISEKLDYIQRETNDTINNLSIDSALSAETEQKIRDSFKKTQDQITEQTIAFETEVSLIFFSVKKTTNNLHNNNK